MPLGYNIRQFSGILGKQLQKSHN